MERSDSQKKSGAGFNRTTATKRSTTAALPERTAVAEPTPEPDTATLSGTGAGVDSVPTDSEGAIVDSESPQPGIVSTTMAVWSRIPKEVSSRNSLGKYLRINDT